MLLRELPSAIVAIPVYNDTQYLSPALDSVLAQSFTNFQLLVVDDGSKQETKDILQTYAQRGVKCLHLPKNEGRPYARNIALTYALNSHKEKGTDYLVWMDADDISLPHRLEKQIAFMQSKPEISVLGAAMRCMGDAFEDDNNAPVIKKSNTHEAIFAQSIWGLSLLQPTACFRLAHFQEQGDHLLYDTSMLRVEDYAFWLKLLFCTPLKFANMSDVLYAYRYAYRPTNNSYHALAAQKLLQYLDLPSDEHSSLMHTALSCSSFDGLKFKKAPNLQEIIRWANTVYECVQSFGKISMTHFLRITHYKMERLLKMESDEGKRLELVKFYATFPLGTTHNLRRLF